MTLGYEAGADSTNRYDDDQIKPRLGRSYWGISLNRHDFDVTKRGERVTLQGNVFGTLALGLFMAVFLAVPGFVHLDKIMSSEDRGGVVLFMLPAIILTITGIVATLSVFKRADVTVLDKALDIHWRSIAGNRHRVVHFSEFAGVLSREYVVRRKNSSTTYQILELAHADEKWSVPIKIRTGRKPMRDEAETLSKALGIPLLRQDGDTITARDSEALDQTIRERVASGALDDSFDVNATPPKGLRLDYVKEGGKPLIKVHVEAPRLPRTFLMLFPIIGIIAPIMAFLDGDPDAFIGIAITTVMFVGIPLFMFRMDAKNPRYLEISTTEVSYHDKAGSRLIVNGRSVNGRSNRKKLKMAEVEEVLVQTDGFMNPVIIAGDKGQMKIASGISKEAATWLRGYIISAIANAPKDAGK
ncbi:MAG: hypothetical protein AAF556_07315 [Pseudomonadota bacterium]